MKKKRENKTREQIIKDLKDNKKFQEKMSFTKETFYPALCKATRSIDDAMSFLSSINTVMMEEFLTFMKDKKFAELRLEDKLDNKDEKYNEIIALLEIFKDKSVFDAKEYIEGMRQEIQLFINEENKIRPLDDLKCVWLDEIVK